MNVNKMIKSLENEYKMNAMRNFYIDTLKSQDDIKQKVDLAWRRTTFFLKMKGKK